MNYKLFISFVEMGQVVAVGMKGRSGVGAGYGCQTHESRAMRGFEGGGPTRTRTVDQRIMSPTKRPVVAVKTPKFADFIEYVRTCGSGFGRRCGRNVDAHSCT
ncbi:hypothetical protein EON09_16045 [Pseudomonas soli]|nr:hypothetical protein [Pseudomonas soli]